MQHVTYIEEEVIHGVNCVCKQYMGTCIANVKDVPKEEEEL
jgi:hypothetical protein